MKVTITVDRWDQQTPEGRFRHHRGDIVTVSEDVAEWLIRSGGAEHGKAAAPAKPTPPTKAADTVDELVPEVPDEGVEGMDVVPSTIPDRPAQSAPKSQWVAYAISCGIPAKEAESMDKPKLISRTS